MATPTRASGLIIGLKAAGTIACLAGVILCAAGTMGLGAGLMAGGLVSFVAGRMMQ